MEMGTCGGQWEQIIESILILAVHLTVNKKISMHCIELLHT